jgi:DNA-binding CsgD family transcriptional regulator
MKRGRPKHDDILTPREWEVLHLLRQGLTNEVIAAELGISFSAAKYHVSEIISKLGVGSREEAVRRADERRQGWLTVPILRWPMSGLTRTVLLYVVPVVALVSVLTLVWLTRSHGDAHGGAPENLVGLDIAPEDDGGFRQAQRTTPWKHTILFTKSTPANVGSATDILASLPTVRSLAALQRAIGPETNLVVVDQSALPELQGSSFLEEQYERGVAVMGLNVCFADLPRSKQQPANNTGGLVWEISPSGEVRYFDTTNTPTAPARCANSFSQSMAQARLAYFSFAPRRPTLEDLDAMRSRGEKLAFDGGGVVRLFDKDTVTFAAALSHLDNGDFKGILPAPDHCEAQQVDGTWWAVPCPN